MPLLPAITLDPPEEARCAVIWLHGLGADGSDFLPVAEALRLPPELGVRFVFPHAPRIPVSVNGGAVMPAWYDIHSLEPGAPVDLEGIRRSAAQVEALMSAQHESGIAPERLVLAGFSQGGLVVLATALQSDQPLAGVMALSTYLPEPVMPARSRPRQVFQAHGRQDPVVPFEIGQAARDRLLAHGHQVEWHEYDMAHSVCAEEVQDIRAWLLRRLG